MFVYESLSLFFLTFAQRVGFLGLRTNYFSKRHHDSNFLVKTNEQIGIYHKSVSQFWIELVYNQSNLANPLHPHQQLFQMRFLFCFSAEYLIARSSLKLYSFVIICPILLSFVLFQTTCKTNEFRFS